ncbi:MAG: hypothetical protein IKI90_08160, partial [Treponema sp.]|nr:hypothetical protein [Treponema sp.]
MTDIKKFDITESLVKNKKLKKVANRVMFSRLALILLLLFAQILIFCLFLFRLNKSFEIYLGSSLTISF